MSRSTSFQKFQYGSHGNEDGPSVGNLSDLLHCFAMLRYGCPNFLGLILILNLKRRIGSQGMDRLVEMLMRVLDFTGRLHGLDIPMSPTRTVAAAAEDAAFPGRQVFEVFSGLFRIYRLRELYMPERGGMLVLSGENIDAY
jgi:hypothetical protein